MKLSPDARHTLGGIGDGRVYLDGVIPPGLETFHAGGWDWLTPDGDVIAGNGSPDNLKWQLWQYRRSTRELRLMDVIIDGKPDNRGASYFFAQGSGRWVAYLADGRTGSFDDRGNQWLDRVAFGMSATGTALFTNPDHVNLIGRTAAGDEFTVQSGAVFNANMLSTYAVAWVDTTPAFGLHMTDRDSPLVPRDGARGALVTGRAPAPGHPDINGRWVAQWDFGQAALVVYPDQVDPPLVGFIISRDGKDFGHDIAIRDDGMLVLATGENQGETVSRYYELDLGREQLRVNGGAWAPCPAVIFKNTTPPDPVDPPIDPPIEPPIPPQPPAHRRRSLITLT